MNESVKNWVCHNCKYLGLIGDWGDCNSQERYNSGESPLLEEAKSTMALFDNEASCRFKVQGNNGIFDDISDRSIETQADNAKFQRPADNQ